MSTENRTGGGLSVSMRELAEDREPKIHDLKCWPESFKPLMQGLKTFEFRFNDRDFQTGDELCLREFNPTTRNYTGRFRIFKVGFIFRGQFSAMIPGHVLRDGWVILSLLPA